MAGSVENRGKGSWRLTVSVGKGPDGKYKKRRKTVNAKNITEARLLLAKFVTEIESGELITASNVRFNDFVNLWRSNYAEVKLSPKTIELYNFLLENYILPNFGHLKLDQIKPMDINIFFKQLEVTRLDGEKGGLSSSTIEKNYNVLSSIFQFAIRNHLIKQNPAKNSEKPVVRYKKRQVYTTEEVSMLFSLLKDAPSHQRLIVTLAIDTGMRRGEILALTWDDINFDKNQISIDKSLSYTKKMGYLIKSTKSENTRKVIASKFLMNQLKIYHVQKNEERSQVAELWEGGKYFFIFSNWNGKPYHPDTPSTWWTRFIKREEFKKITFHDLRHTAATLLINQGLHAKIISERLGHTDIKITMNTYGHFLEEADQKAADIMDNFYNSFK